jgi:hypothetical protein
MHKVLHAVMLLVVKTNSVAVSNFACHVVWCTWAVPVLDYGSWSCPDPPFPPASTATILDRLIDTRDPLHLHTGAATAYLAALLRCCWLPGWERHPCKFLK